MVAVARERGLLQTNMLQEPVLTGEWFELAEVARERGFQKLL